MVEMTYEISVMVPSFKKHSLGTFIVWYIESIALELGEGYSAKAAKISLLISKLRKIAAEDS